MRSREKLLITLSWSMCVAALICAVVVLTVLFVPSASIRIRYFILCLGGAFLLPTAAVLLRSFTDINEKRRKTMVLASVIFMFVLYILVLMCALLLTKFLSNGENFQLSYNKYWLSDALPGLVPFSSIGPLFKNFAVGRASTRLIAFDLGGNLFMYAPFAFFMPALFKGMRRLDTFLPFIVFLAIAVEMVQGMFGLGTFKTDDLVLGVGGAVITFLILNAGPLVEFFRKYYFYD